VKADDPVSFFVVNGDGQEHKLALGTPGTSFSLGDFPAGAPGRDVPPVTLAGGTWTLSCTIHPTMQGTLTAS
ncbi:MAG: cupredoxin domain-containing protein, partial [Thermoplasmatota archaeon]